MNLTIHATKTLARLDELFAANPWSKLRYRIDLEVGGRTYEVTIARHGMRGFIASVFGASETHTAFASGAFIKLAKRLKAKAQVETVAA